MQIRYFALIVPLLWSTSVVYAQSATPIPAGLRHAEPHEVVERVLHQQGPLALSAAQITSLTAWHESVADEPHRFKHDPSSKPHDVTHMPMISRQAAFDSTVALLTPGQRSQLATLFAGMPPGLEHLAPHEVVEQVLKRKSELALSEHQVVLITAWHESVADEPHRFKHDVTKKPHDVTHVAMISRAEAFDSTVALLTPVQQAQLATLFPKRP